MLLPFFALTALTLAIVGLYGTLSHAVTVRRREIGLRLALGALRVEIVRQFLGHALRVVFLASLCGVVLSFGIARVLARMLYGVSRLIRSRSPRSSPSCLLSRRLLHSCRRCGRRVRSRSRR